MLRQACNRLGESVDDADRQYVEEQLAALESDLHADITRVTADLLLKELYTLRIRDIQEAA